MNPKTIRHLTAPILLMALAIQSYQIQPPSCQEFYRKEGFANLMIDKKPILGMNDLDAYSFRITWQEGYKKTKSIAIYKTKTSQNLKAYAQTGDLLKKTRNDYAVIIARQIDSALDIQKFDLSCEQ